MRDDFSSDTINVLSRRVGMRCSNPLCRTPTSGPRSNEAKTINVGVAAHIHAAAPGGPRYQEFMSANERSDIRNGIWLCQNCHKLVDNDPARYTAALLLQWKEDAEMVALREMQKSGISGEPVMIASPVYPGMHREVIAFRLDNSFMGTDTDLRNLAVRMAVASKEGKGLDMQIRYPEFDDVVPDNEKKYGAYDSVQIAEVRRAKDQVAEKIRRAVLILFSQAAHDSWSIYLDSVEDWHLALKRTLSMYCPHAWQGTSEKLDVWRTDEPGIYAPIYLTEKEVVDALDKLKLEKVEYLAFGAGWRAADELPRGIIVEKIIPRMALAIADAGLTADDPKMNEIMFLASWHIGRG